MQRRTLAGISAWLAVAFQAHAQLAAPQVRTPWADSTHITGVAERVMPETPASPPIVDPLPSPPTAPTTVQEFLERLSGAEIYFREIWDSRSGWEELPGIVRVVVRSDGAEIQAHNQYQPGWMGLCTLTPWNTQCTVSGVNAVNLMFDINSWAISITGASCLGGYFGSAYGAGAYSWEAYAQGQGAFSNQNRHSQPADNGYSGYFFLNGGFQSSCYYEMPG